MLTRRKLLQGALALPGLGLVQSGRVLAAGDDPAAAPRLERLVYDSRFAGAALVAEHVGGHGVPLSAIAGDLMPLWYDELDPLWRESPQPLAGITTLDSLFILQTLALDKRMRVIFRGEHGQQVDGMVEHWLTGDPDVLAPVVEQMPELGWEQAIGDMLVSYPLDPRAESDFRVTTETSAISLREVVLVSWIIAPRSTPATVAALGLTGGY